MKPAASRSIAAFGLAALGTALASSCSVPQQTTADAQPSTRSTAARTAVRIAQLQFGQQAAVAACDASTCPTSTPKTLWNEATPVLDAPAAPKPDVAFAGNDERATHETAPQDPGLPRKGSGQTVVVYFAFGHATLSPAARAAIDEATAGLPAAQHIAISGRTDDVGPRQVNQALALARANAVRDHLLARHPRWASAVTLESQGSCCFAAPNDTARGRALNRRVELVFEQDAGDL